MIYTHVSHYIHQMTTIKGQLCAVHWQSSFICPCTRLNWETHILFFSSTWRQMHVFCSTSNCLNTVTREFEYCTKTWNLLHLEQKYVYLLVFLFCLGIKASAVENASSSKHGWNWNHAYSIRKGNSALSNKNLVLRVVTYYIRCSTALCYNV